MSLKEARFAPVVPAASCHRPPGANSSTEGFPAEPWALELEAKKGGEQVSRGMKPGDVAFRQKGEVHRAINKGRGRYRNILIELK